MKKETQMNRMCQVHNLTFFLRMSWGEERLEQIGGLLPPLKGGSRFSISAGHYYEEMQTHHGQESGFYVNNHKE